jgi:hypothetical protein
MSNAFDKASLVMLPHAYEEGKVYSLKPTDRSGDFTYSRGTDTATRVGEDGYIKKEYENLLSHSNSFTTSPWSLATGATLTSGISDPDGGTNAWQLNFDGTANARLQQQVSVASNSVYTFSFYGRVSSGTKDISVGAVGSLTTKTLTTEWQRIELFGVTTGTITFPQIRTKDTSVYSIEIYQAQFNPGLVAYPYLETTTAPVYGGLTDNMPRLDYSGGATCPSLLLEPQRTNDIAHSEYINSAANSTISRNDGISPEGVENAIKVTLTGTSQAGVNTSNAYVSLNTTYTQSCYVKKDVGDYFGFGYFQLDMPIENNNYIRWNLSDITIQPDVQGSYINGKAEDFGNGWIRLSATITTVGNSTRGGWKFLGMTSSNNFQLSNIGDSFYLYGIQAEPNATYPTSYIPTYGSSQTRVYDNANLLNIDTNIVDITGDFTFYVDNTGSLMKGTELYHYFIDLFWDSITSIRYYSTSNGSWYFKPANDYTGFTNSVGKQIIKYENGVFYHFLNGDKSTSTRTMATTSSLSKIQFFANTNGRGGYLDIKQALLFNTALSDDECEALTAI